MGGAALPIALAGGGTLLSALGNKKGADTGVAVPPDLKDSRGQQIDITEGGRTTRIEGDVFHVLREALGGHE